MKPIDNILKRLWQNKETLYLSELQLNRAGIDSDEIKSLITNNKITVYNDNNYKINISNLY